MQDKFLSAEGSSIAQDGRKWRVWLFEFCGRFLANLDFHFQPANRSLARMSTSSTSSSSAFPAPIPFILRHISMSHAVAISFSFGPSKLATNFLIT